MKNFYANLVESITKNILKKLRSVFSPEMPHFYSPSTRVNRGDKRAYIDKHQNYKRKHQRHERNK